MAIIYRILSLIINIFSFFIAVTLILLIPASLVMPPFWLPVFLLVAVVLYTWFSNKFRRLVLRQKEVVRTSLKDWVKVNGYVTIVFSILSLPGAIALLRNPAVYMANMYEMMGKMGNHSSQAFTERSAIILALIMIFYFLILLVHVFWTFALIRKHAQYFQ
ncbi:MAG: hypothetical protein ACR2KZ_00595 [Segetibacter sp.]